MRVPFSFEIFVRPVKMNPRTISTIAALLLAGLFLISRSKEKEPSPLDEKKVVSIVKSPNDPTPNLVNDNTQIADEILRGYGSQLTAYQDLERVSGLLETVVTLNKGVDSKAYSTNEDLVLFLTGENPNRERYLSADHALISQDGLLLDRWQVPLIVHPLGHGRTEFRSAGPDRAPYTDDDILWPPPSR